MVGLMAFSAVILNGGSDRKVMQRCWLWVRMVDAAVHDCVGKLDWILMLRSAERNGTW